MGSVWVARHLELDTEVAVKFMASELSRDTQALARFRAEAKLAAQIRDPHVAQPLDAGVLADGTPFIVMELLSGSTLGAHLAREIRLDPLEVLDLVEQAAQGLDAAHRLGVVHRDIKPDNVFLSSSGGKHFVKLLDFGIAKQRASPAGAQTAQNAVFGTPAYMSPEQFLSTKDVDHRADLWALAVVTYEAFTGCPPFAGETFAALALAAAKGVFAKPSALVPALPCSVDAWFERALCVIEEGRFDSALEMSAALRTALEGIPALRPDRASMPTGQRAPSAEPSGAYGPTLLADSVSDASSPALNAKEDAATLRTVATTRGPVAMGQASRRVRAWAILGSMTAVAASVGLVVLLQARAPRSSLPHEAGSTPAADFGAHVSSMPGPSTATADGSARPAAAALSLQTQSAATAPDSVREPAPKSAAEAVVGPSSKTTAGGVATAAASAHGGRAAPSPHAPTGPDCTNPYYADAEGHVHVRRECVK